MPVRLNQIKTLSDLYKASILKAVEVPAFPPKNALLDRVSLYQGDITKLELDSIVNAANKSLLGGGGVDGAIHAAAGRDLLKECRTLNGCETGDAKITKGYNLPSRAVIHTVGPVYSASKAEKKAEQLASCYEKSLQLAAKNSLKHIAFPSISTGIYGYPIESATHIALRIAREFLDSEEGNKLDRVVFVVWSDGDRTVYEELLPIYFPPDEEAETSEPAAAATPEVAGKIEPETADTSGSETPDSETAESGKPEETAKSEPDETEKPPSGETAKPRPDDSAAAVPDESAKHESDGIAEAEQTPRSEPISEEKKQE